MTPDRPPPPARDLAPIVYDELRRLAAAYMRRERPGRTMNPAGLGRERRRTQRATRLLDVITAILLFADAALIARTAALPGVFALALALGIALAAFVLEPATTAAAFGENREP
jgi:hypothetical protein